MHWKLIKHHVNIIFTSWSTVATAVKNTSLEQIEPDDAFLKKEPEHVSYTPPIRDLTINSFIDEGDSPFQNWCT